MLKMTYVSTDFNELISYSKPPIDKIGDQNICPSSDKIFRCFDFFNVHETKIIILGQDPYYTKGEATGLAFECNGAKQKSLENILKHYGKPKIDFPEMAKKGVLLLNTALTTEEGKAKVHTTFWKPFTTSILDAIANINESPLGNKSYTDEELKTMKGPLFVCFGNDAINICSKFSKKICCSHPSPLGYTKSLSSGYPAFKDANIIERARQISGVDL